LKESKPYLFGAVNNSSSTVQTPKPGDGTIKKATEMTKEEYAKAKQDFLNK